MYMQNIKRKFKQWWTTIPPIWKKRTITSRRNSLDFIQVLRFPPPKNWPPRYNWNIVESGVKYHNSNPNNNP